MGVYRDFSRGGIDPKKYPEHLESPKARYKTPKNSKFCSQRWPPWPLMSILNLIVNKTCKKIHDTNVNTIG